MPTETVWDAGEAVHGCLAVALLSPAGELLACEPPAVVFPARALTAIQDALPALTGSQPMPIPLPHHVVEVTRLEDGRLLAALRLRRARTRTAAGIPPGTLRVTIRSAPRPVAAPAPPIVPAPAQDDRAESDSRAEPAEPSPPVAGPESSPAIAEQPPESDAIWEAGISRLRSGVSPGESIADLRNELLTGEPAPPAEPAASAPEPPGPVAEASPPVDGRVFSAADAAAAISRPATQSHRGRDLELMALTALAALALLLAAGLAWWLVRYQRAALVATPSVSSSSVPSPTAGASPIVSPALRPSQPPPPAVLHLAFAGNLGRGSTGDAVRALQARLRQLHYFTYPTDTGYFGDATYGAVFSFQQDQGLPATGIANRDTIDALNGCDAGCVR